MSAATPVRRTRLAAAVVAAALVSFAATSWVSAAFTATTGSLTTTTAGSVAVDGDGTGALLSFADGTTASSDTACLTLTSTGTLDSELRHYTTSSGSLVPYLDARVEKGTSTTGYDDCSGFTPDPVSYRGRGHGVLYDGPLSGLGTTWDTGTRDPAGPGGLGGGYASAVAATPGLVNHWRLGDSAAWDSFTGTAGTQIGARPGDSGMTWQLHPSLMRPQDAARGVLTAAGRVRREGSGRLTYQASTVPSSADYAVEADVHVASMLPGDEAVLQARVSDAGTRYYQWSYETAPTTSRWTLLRVQDEVVTVLGSFDQTMRPGETHRARLEVQGSTVRGYVDGVLRVSGTDTAVTATGRPGIGLGWDAALAIDDDSDGFHLDDFRVVDASPPPSLRDSRGTADGTWYGSPASVDGALGGDPDRGVRLTPSADHGRVPRQVADDFTVAFWFRSDQGEGAGGQFYDGSGLVQGDVPVSDEKDFGVSLQADGTVVAGTGTADVDRSVTSGPGYDDDRWHHVAFTRLRSSGTIALYLDGSPAASRDDASTASLTSAPELYLGRRADGQNSLRGALDEVATWDRALSPTEVAALVAANGSGTETWSQGERHAYRVRVSVRDDPAAYNRSADVALRWEARNR